MQTVMGPDRTPEEEITRTDIHQTDILREKHAETVRCQNPAIQHVSLVLLVGFILFVRNLLHGNLR